MTHSVLSGHLSRARVTVENKLGGFQECSREDCTLLDWSFTENRDTLHIRRLFSRARVTSKKDSVVFNSALVRNVPHWLGSFVKNRDTLRIRMSFSPRTSYYQKKLSGLHKCNFLGFRHYGVGFRIKGLKFRIQGFRVREGLGFRVQGLGFRV